MYESVHGAARRVLIVGSQGRNADFFPDEMLAQDGLLIVMESDAGRAAEIRRNLSRTGMGERATVISGDPRRMLYKLAGPFDVIFCSAAYLSTRPTLEKLLAPDGVLVTHDQP